MIRRLPVRILALVLMAQMAACAVDTSPYIELLDEISQKERALSDARSRGDWNEVISLTKEIDSLRGSMSEPRMAFLREYETLGLALDESGYLIGQMSSDLPEADISRLEQDYEAASAAFDQAESAYSSQDYESALSLLTGSEGVAASLPSLLALEAKETVEALRSEMERAGRVTPSTVAMLVDSRNKLAEANSTYDAMSREVLAGRTREAARLAGRARDESSEALGLAARARGLGGTLLDPVELALILGPVMLMIGLLFYFHSQFRRLVIACSVSSDEAPAGRESKLDRYIVVTNIEKVPVTMKVMDSPPRALRVSELQVPVKQRSGNTMLWEFELPPGGKKSIDYKLRVPNLDAGWNLRVQAAIATYLVDGTQKKYVGKPSEVSIV